MPSLREAQKQLTRDTIVERALELFTAKGYAATTIDEIAASAGTTRVTFYAYYPTRADLMRDFMARVNAVLERADGPDSASTAPDLVQVVRDGKLAGILSWLESRAALWPVFRPYLDVLDEAAAVDTEVRAMVEGWHEEVISDMVRGMQQAGRFAAETRHIRGTLAFTQLDYVATLWTRRKMEPNREHALEVLADSWYHLLCDAV
ncbi:transcriptional regulator, TetR family [Pseudarthrobacter chlorophenolicus A6]|uniref:Transcriptional regulator, TetR family n=1 Tax=Pseudarthrobacter chlorophenolicus (strain ATCC 700700 / DSM 12829 / CIP 107037 / JCM 12360 / KCTC 9906 / NCIMB 13794 / A6) TaxID=452863 RepID=B8HC49_PSECP|nr:TetR/AcrR family transcriptional regulator [Pseudarthrobacter chlorophenolicus]ACL38759.1 transcriptional regulator, TetR family [Pseudarthrobacter chlorophenolicus A6]SDR09130.1 DNA-binding transcriptional regulator, AcrR family [Pseudarthrobacter chlorophenolicus]